MTSPVSVLSRNISVLLFLTILIVASADAAEDPWFVEFGFGGAEIDSRYELHGSDFRVCRVESYYPFETVTHVCDPVVSSGFESNDTFRLNLGHYVGDDWGMLLGYQEFGSFGSTLAIIHEVFPFHRESQIEAKGVSIQMFGEIPFAAQWAVIGKFGVFYSRTIIAGRDFYPDFDASESTIARTNFSRRENSRELNLSVGLAYKINARYSAHLDYQPFRNIADSEIETVTLSLAVRF